MTTELLIGYAALWATLLQALLRRAKLIRPSCSRCGRALERRALGEQICSC
jgi:hypothetical protein